MKKPYILLTAILGLSGLEVLGAYFAGYLTQEKFKDNILKSKQMLVPGALEILSYDRGLFSSEAKLSVEGFGNKETFLIHFLHGPIIFDKSSTIPIQFKAAIARGQQEAFTMPINTLFVKTALTAPMRWKISVNYSGDLNYEMEGKAAKGQANDRFVESAGFKLTGKVNLSSNETQSHSEQEMVFPEILVKKDEEATDYISRHQNSKMTANIDMIGKEDFKSDVLFSVQKINGKMGVEWAADDLKFAVNAFTLPQNVEAALDINVHNLSFAERSYGPLEMHFRFLDIDKAPILSLQTKMLELLKAGKIDPNLVSQDLILVLNQIFSKRPEVILDKGLFILPEGQIDVTGKIALGGEAFKGGSIDALLKTAEGALSLLIPKSAFRNLIAFFVEDEMTQDKQYEKMDFKAKMETLERKVDQYIANLSNEKYLNARLIKEKEDNYEIGIVYSKGRFLSEGKELKFRIK